MSMFTDFKQWKCLCYALAGGLLFALIYNYFFYQRAQLDIEFTTTLPHAQTFKVYWKSDGGGFKELKHTETRFRKAVNKFSLLVGGQNFHDALRLDPMETSGEVTFQQIRLTQYGYEPLVLNDAASFSRLIANDQVESSEYTEQGYKVVIDGNDGYLTLPLARDKVPGVPWQRIISLLLLFLIGASVTLLIRRATVNHQHVPVLMLAALALVFTMASISNYGVHPDEPVHYAASRYYAEQWLPPRADDEAIAHSYSVYGVSRLNSTEVYYHVAGTFARIFDGLRIEPHLSIRLVNVGFLLLMVFLMWRYPAARLVGLPLLISAQVWYLFSYINSDAFGLLICFVIAIQAVYKQSALNHYLTDEWLPARYWHGLWLGLLFGCIPLLKENYYFFGFFIVTYLGWRMLYGDFVDRRLLFKRIALMAVVGLTLVAGRVLLTQAQHGFEKSTVTAEMQEKHAKYWYRASTPIDKTPALLYLKDRGISLDEVIHNFRWFEQSFRSSFGVYDFFRFFASLVYYDIVRVVLLMFFAFITISVLWQAPLRSGSLLGLVLLSGGLLIAVSLRESWLVSFQAQGRYLLPILLMFGVFYYHVHEQLNQRITQLFTLALYGLAVYSFVYVGLLNIPKINPGY